MKKYMYEVSEKDLSLGDKCIICGEKITDDEWAFEDYYVIFRGVTSKAFHGVMCFSCGHHKKDQ